MLHVVAGDAAAGAVGEPAAGAPDERAGGAPQLAGDLGDLGEPGGAQRVPAREQAAAGVQPDGAEVGGSDPGLGVGGAGGPFGERLAGETKQRDGGPCRCAAAAGGSRAL